jgi:hypothetical protein
MIRNERGNISGVSIAWTYVRLALASLFPVGKTVLVS